MRPQSKYFSTHSKSILNKVKAINFLIVIRKNSLLHSYAASLVACYVLGVRDRNFVSSFSSVSIVLKSFTLKDAFDLSWVHYKPIL
jgi:hypothetical protein